MKLFAYIVITVHFMWLSFPMVVSPLSRLAALTAEAELLTSAVLSPTWLEFEEMGELTDLKSFNSTPPPPGDVGVSNSEGSWFGVKLLPLCGGEFPALGDTWPSQLFLVASSDKANLTSLTGNLTSEVSITCGEGEGDEDLINSSTPTTSTP